MEKNRAWSFFEKTGYDWRTYPIDSWRRFWQVFQIADLFINPPPFSFYDFQHLMVLVIGLAVIIWLIGSARRWPGRVTEVQRWVVAVILFVIFPLNLWIYPQMGFQRPWPMHLCDWAALTGGFALLSKRQLFVELTYFWALAGGLNALLTPDVHEGFPHPRFVVFFIHHIAIIAVALWIAVGMKQFPRRDSVWKVFGWTQLFVIAALITNRITGHNYGFLAFKPEIEHPLLDLIGPWPWYILSLELVALIFFLILDLPWVFVRKRQGNAINP